jgi:uncharacterized membrane protein YfcA
MFELLPHYTLLQWSILFVCAILVGITKTGIPGIGILCVPFLAMAFPARMSTGLMLPMLAVADIFAVVYYQRYTSWKIIIRLLPWALAGVVIGTAVVRYIGDREFRPLIGMIILVLLTVNLFYQRYWRDKEQLPSHWLFSASMGLAAGLLSQVANAAGSVMVIYLLSMRLQKNEYIGTSAWFFLILNWTKMPLFILDGRINFNVIAADVFALPFIIAGALSGIFILRKLPLKWFNIIIQLLAVASAVKLIFS